MTGRPRPDEGKSLRSRPGRVCEKPVYQPSVSGWVAASRPKALAMAPPNERKTIAKLRLTLPPGEDTAFYTPPLN